MIRQRLLLMCAAVSLCAFSPSGSAPVAAAIGQGKASGAWQLPVGPQPGFVEGDLFLSPSPTAVSPPVYHFTGVLTTLPVPASSMLKGTIQGQLDDGVGPGPDFLVAGNYSGNLSTVIGTGTFSAQFIKPAAAAPSGVIAGTFADMLISTTSAPGTFSGRWKLSN